MTITKAKNKENIMSNQNKKSRSRWLTEDERALQYKLIWSGLNYYKVRDIMNEYRLACGYSPVILNPESYNMCARILRGKDLSKVKIHIFEGKPIDGNSCK